MGVNTEKFKGLLLARAEDIRATLAEAKSSSSAVELDQTRVGRLSRMDAMERQAMAKATLARRELELKRIDAALGRISADDYGYCHDCGEDIPEKRLMADPTALTCAVCRD